MSDFYLNQAGQYSTISVWEANCVLVLNFWVEQTVMVSPDNVHAANIEYLMKYVWKVKFENVIYTLKPKVLIDIFQ